MSRRAGHDLARAPIPPPLVVGTMTVDRVERLIGETVYRLRDLSKQAEMLRRDGEALIRHLREVAGR